MRVHTCAAPLLLALLAGCGDCNSPEQTSSANSAAPLAPAEEWSLSELDVDAKVALPPPCEAVAGLRGRIARPNRLHAGRRTIDRIIGVQGPLLATGNGQRRNDAAAVYQMSRGRARRASLPWPDRGDALVAHATQPDAWLLALPDGRGAKLWQAGEIWSSDKAINDVWCGASDCGVLFRGRRGQAELRMGAIAEPQARWQPLQLRHPAVATARAAKLLQASGTIQVAFVDNERVHVVAHNGDDSELVAQLPAAHGALDVVASPKPAALTYTGALDARGCAESAAGVNVVTSDRRVTLRSPLPPSEGQLTPLRGGWLVSWRSPLRCESTQQLLYAAIVDVHGRAIAPVTSVAEAESYAVASAGDDVALWLVQDGAVNWLHWRCVLRPQ